jgi:DNA-binding response OmpR family regulator
MSRSRILVVDDDPKIVSSIRLYLEHAGFDVVTAYNGRQALEEARATPPELVVLDLMLPQVDGLEVCRALRAESSVPIIMLTARASEDDKLQGLDLGADDYLTKPFSPRELVARIRAVLRRAPSDLGEGALHVGDVALDLARHEVRRGDTPVSLTPREFALLAALMRAPGRAFPRQELAERAFGDEYQAMDRTLDAHVMNLRRKLGDALDGAPIVETVFGVGYRLRDVASA